MGLTFQEIDQLSSVCGVTGQSMVLWKEFSKMLAFRQVDRKILERAAIHL